MKIFNTYNGILQKLHLYWMKKFISLKYFHLLCCISADKLKHIIM